MAMVCEITRPYHGTVKCGFLKSLFRLCEWYVMLHALWPRCNITYRSHRRKSDLRVLHFKYESLSTALFWLKCLTDI
jgi:hypothetical protein